MKREVSYGLYYGGFSILLMLVMYVTELNRMPSAGSLNYLTLAVLAYFTVQLVKDVKAENGGFITFSKIFKGGLSIGLIGGVLSSIFFYVQVKFIDTGYVKFVLDQAIIQMQKKGMTDDVIDQSIKMIENWTTPEMMLLTGVLGSLFFSSIVAVIMAFIMKKPNPNEIA
ncbi:MAG: DUF4199 domain-containing protein [Bacteroidota bacterium]|jgi:hypothetical protein